MASASETAMEYGNTQACAACKYQRRKCGPNCILAPYFPHDRQKQFLNAHRLFGVGKITNLIKPLDPQRRDLAMSTIIYESNMRARDPVGGCYTLLLHLDSQIQHASSHLRLLLQHLHFFRTQSNAIHASSSQAIHTLHHHNINQYPLLLDQNPGLLDLVTKIKSDY